MDRWENKVKPKHIRFRTYSKEALFLLFLTLFGVVFCLVTKKTVYMSRIESYSDNVVTNDSCFFTLVSQEGMQSNIAEAEQILKKCIRGATLLQELPEHFEYSVIYTDGITDIFNGEYSEAFNRGDTQGALVGKEVLNNADKLKKIGEIIGVVEDYGIPVKRKAVFRTCDEKALLCNRVYVISSRYRIFEKKSLERLSAELDRQGIKVIETSSGHIMTGSFVSNIRFASLAYGAFFFVFILINLVTIRIWRRVRKNMVYAAWICGESHPERKDSRTYLVINICACIVAVIISRLFMDKSEYEVMVAILLLFVTLCIDMVSVAVAAFRDRRRRG